MWHALRHFPLTSPTCQGRSKGYSGESPLSPPHPHPIWDSSLPEQRIFVTASGWRSRAEKLILNRDVDRFLPLPFFYRTPVSRDIDCLSLAKISEILAGADICWRQYFVTLLHGRPVQMSRYSVGESQPIKGGGERQPVTW
jgi:hypothetical protein